MHQSKAPQCTAQHPQPTPAAPVHQRKRTLVAALGIGLAVALSGCNDDTGKDGDEESAASKSPSERASQSSDPAAPGGDEPMVEGWQTQTSQKHHFRYDVPDRAEKWKVLDKGTALS
ncbi:hypothetical protein [Streptomyces qinglanensis]|uniref:hypothetical protein n=1 Tax=Streptomyces qinglanensis TaxID=943816 RepID=UPI003D74B0BE